MSDPPRRLPLRASDLHLSRVFQRSLYEPLLVYAIGNKCSVENFDIQLIEMMLSQLAVLATTVAGALGHAVMTEPVPRGVSDRLPDRDLYESFLIIFRKALLRKRFAALQSRTASTTVRFPGRLTCYLEAYVLHRQSRSD